MQPPHAERSIWSSCIGTQAQGLQGAQQAGSQQAARAAWHKPLGPLFPMPSIFSLDNIKTFATLIMRRMEMDAEVPVILASI